ncbi:MAG TPA: HAD-IA family hydrolase [Actinomycetes bacterium]|nr:HAD-IA family hydrolase [Actinomycetes bacterium]
MTDTIPRPLAAVFLDAGDTLLAPAPSFEGRFIGVARVEGVELAEAAVAAAAAAAARRAVWPTDWTDPATQREFWCGHYTDILGELRYQGDRAALADRMFEAFSDPAAYKLFDDARPALDALAARGLKLGVISNFEPWLATVLELEGVDHLFAATAISGVLGVAKPEPGIFLSALQQAGVEAGSAIHVGDHLDVDVTGARAVGMTGVLIDRYGRVPDPPPGVLRIKSLAELVDLVDAGLSEACGAGLSEACGAGLSEACGAGLSEAREAR